MPRRYGPREWSPRAPEAEDFKQTLVLWGNIQRYLKQLSGIEDINHIFSLAIEWMEGHGEKPTRDQLYFLNSGINALVKGLDQVNTAIQEEALPQTIELAKWLKKATKEGRRS